MNRMHHELRRAGLMCRLALLFVYWVGAFASEAHASSAVGSPDTSDDKPRELIVWGALKRRGLDAAIRRFEQEHPGWQVVTSTAAGAGQMDPQKLMCGIAGGSPPDTLIQDRFSVGEWAIRDAFVPLDDRIRESVREEGLARSANDAVVRGDLVAAGAPLRELIVALRGLGTSRQLKLAEELLIEAGQGRETKAMSARTAELVSLCQGIHPEQFYKACWEEASFGEGSRRRAYAIPNSTDARALYYNEDLLERAGLVDANGKARPPRDWDELEAYSLKLTERDSRGNLTRLGFAPLFGNSWLYLYSWLNGGEFMSPDGRTCTLNDPRAVDALQFIVRLYDRLGGVERVEAFQSTFQAAELDPFLTGKVAMKIDGDYFQNTIALHAPRMRFAVAPPPAPRGRDSVTWSGGYSWVIPAGAKNPEMAFEFIRFLMTDRVWNLRYNVEARYASSRGRSYIAEMAPLPHVNRDAYDQFMKDSPDLAPRFKSHFLLFTDLMNVSRYRPVTPVGQLLWDEHARACEKAIRHAYTPGEALERGRVAVQRQLDQIAADPSGRAVGWGAAMWPLAGTMVVGAGAFWFWPGRADRLRQLRRREVWWGYAFLSPWLIGFLMLTAGPIIASVVYSFCHYDVLHPAQYVGVENYRQLLFDDPLFWRSLGNTAYMMLGLPLGMAAGLGIAMLLNTEVRGMRVYRTIFYLPAIVPVVASSLLWIWVLNPELGLLNSMLRTIGIEHPPRWLSSPSWLLGSKAAIILMGLWGAGSGMVVWLAGLKGIPRHLYEAAEIDGAGPWRSFCNVTLPMLSPYIFFNLIMGVIGTMQLFSQAYIMTQGGPDDSTLFYAYYLFNSAFRYFRMGYASAMAWVLFLIVLALTLVQLWLSRRWVHYDTV